MEGLGGGLLAWPTPPPHAFEDGSGARWTTVRGAFLHRCMPWLLLAGTALIAWNIWVDASEPALSLVVSALFVCGFGWRIYGSRKHEVLAWRIDADRRLLALNGDGSVRDLGRVEAHEPFGDMAFRRFGSFTHWTWRFPKQQLKKGDRVTGILGKLISPLFSIGLFSISGDLLVGDYQGRHLLIWPFLRQPETCALVETEAGTTFLLTARSSEALAAGLAQA